MIPDNATQSLNLQERDFLILRELFASRAMTATHIGALYFSGSQEAAKKRLLKIKAAGLIRERTRRVNEKSVLFLTPKAHALLKERQLLSEFPALSSAAFERRSNVSDLTLRHELEVMDVKAAFYSALKDSETLTVAEFTTWPRLIEFQAARSRETREDILVKPDGFIRIHEKERDGGLSEHTFFLEVDRSTETQITLANRANCYLDYYISGGFAVRNGASRQAYKDFPFRVLIVLKNAERRNNTAERLLQNNPPILTQTYLSTFKEVIANPLGDIWTRPVDYREVVKGTVFEKRRQAATYQRQTEREILVENALKKLALLNGS